jgi:hypothetical protein
MLRPRFESWESGRDYRVGPRRTFLCSKQRALEGLDAEPIRVSPLQYVASAGELVLREAGGLRRSWEERGLSFGPSRGLPPRR